MTKKNLKKLKNGKDLIENPKKSDLVPLSIGDSAIKEPKKLETIGDVIREQQRLYKFVFDGTLAVSDLTKLMYALSQIIQGLKAKSEIDALEDAYIKQWQGVKIIAPAGEDIPDPMKQAIEGEIIDG